MNPEQAKAAGYAIISRKYYEAARLDTPEWKQRLAATHVDGMDWVDGLGDQRAADYYRRCRSGDVISVPRSWIRILPNSHNGKSEWAPKEGE